MDNDTLTIVEYIRDGKSPFEEWFNSLDAVPAARVAASLYRLELGSFSNVKSVGRGVIEQRIDSGPGYRIYFGKEGNSLIILLCGGTKRRQSRDIEKAQALWRQFKKDKKVKGR